MTVSLPFEPDHLLASQRRFPPSLSAWRRWGAPACMAVLVHTLAVGAVLLGWSPQPPAAPVLTGSSVSLALMTTAPAADPAPAPAAVVPKKIPERVPEIAPEPDRGAIARERRQREQQRQQEREQKLREQRLSEQEERKQALRQAQQSAREKAEREQAGQAQPTNAQPGHGQDQWVSQYQPASKVTPDYPRKALERGIEGDCTVQYDVRDNGRVSRPKVVSCDHPLFERPSVRAASAFRYTPHRVNGRAVSVPGIRNTFRFRIQ